MKKNEFIVTLAAKLSGLPQDDVERSLAYYSEYIDDAVEDGRSEEEAVAALGTPAEVAEMILSEVSFFKLLKNKLRTPHAMQAWMIVLIVIGAPLWISLLAAAVSVVLSVYAVIWSVVVAFLAVTVALGSSAVGGLLGAIYLLISGNFAAGLFLGGAAFVCAGLGILFWYVSRYAIYGAVRLGRVIWLGIKRLFVKKEVQVL